MPTPKTVTDPSPSKFRKQFLLVAVVLIILGIIVFIIASTITGGIIALLGIIFGLGSRVVTDIPIE